MISQLNIVYWRSVVPTSTNPFDHRCPGAHRHQVDRTFHFLLSDKSLIPDICARERFYLSNPAFGPVFSLPNEIKYVYDTLIQSMWFFLIKSNAFQGDITDVSAITKTLLLASYNWNCEGNPQRASRAGSDVQMLNLLERFKSSASFIAEISVSSPWKLNITIT